MNWIKTLFSFLIFQSMVGIALGQQSQQNLVYNHYFLNPSLYNPSYVGSDGYTQLFLNYRTNWSGFGPGSAKTGTLGLQVPLSYKSGLGVNLYNDKAGILETNTGMLSFAYQIYLGKSLTVLHRLGFGLSFGLTSTKLSSNNNDPALKSNSSNMDGQFGLNYQLNKFKISFALPRLIESKIVTESTFSSSRLEPLQSAITTVSYNFQLSKRIAFEPFLLYRAEHIQPSQLEGLGVLRIDNLGWIGASYRQKYGASAFIGLNLKEKIKVGYAYEFAPNQVTGFGNGAHEIQLVLKLSRNKKERPGMIAKEEIKEEIVKETETEKPENEKANTEEIAKGDSAEETNDAGNNEPVVQNNEPQNSEPVIENPVVKKAEEPLPIVQPTPTQGSQAETKQPQARPAVAKQETPLPPVEEPSDVKKMVGKTLEGQDLAPGNYVVVGAFESVTNAKNYKATLKRAGYPAEVAFDPAKKFYLVHMGVTLTLDDARRLRDVYRQKSRYSFKDTWILIIE